MPDSPDSDDKREDADDENDDYTWPEYYPDDEDESDYEDSLAQRIDYLEEKILALVERVAELEFKLQGHTLTVQAH